jgi:hypothetical protein
MATILTKEQSRSLYGVTGKGEIVAFGRSVKNTITNVVRHRGVEITDCQTVSEFHQRREEEAAERARREARRAAPELRSEVVDIL